MRRPSALPIWVQVAGLAVLAVVMSQVVAFTVVVLAPEPKPAGFSLAAAAAALAGEPAETGDGRPLRRRFSDVPAQAEPHEVGDPLAVALRAGLARRLDVSPEAVRVSMRHPARRRFAPPPGDRARVNMIIAGPGQETPPKVQVPDGHEARSMTVVIPDAGSAGPGRTGFTLRRSEGAAGGARVEQFTIVADRLTFAPFSASVRQADGRWAIVEPPRDLLAPWQMNLLTALGISMLLLAPLVWWMARRLTRPIRVFATAAERLGADPDADPLPVSGPSEVRTAIHAFNEMQASLRGHIRRRTQTVAAIAHDLRTPLTRLRFRAEQVQPEVRDRMAADIEEMDALIAQAMAYVRGEAPLERRELMDLNALAADCAQGFAETGADVVFEGGVPLVIEADPAALRRALANLIGNAIKYAGAARVRTFREADRAIVAVEDDGPGLPANELEAVFEPFHRGERSRNRETGGAGLGLTVARQAARAHGGDVILGNRPDGGLSAVMILNFVERSPTSAPVIRRP